MIHGSEVESDVHTRLKPTAGRSADFTCLVGAARVSLPGEDDTGREASPLRAIHLQLVIHLSGDIQVGDTGLQLAEHGGKRPIRNSRLVDVRFASTDSKTAAGRYSCLWRKPLRA